MLRWSQALPSGSSWRAGAIGFVLGNAYMYLKVREEQERVEAVGERLQLHVDKHRELRRSMMDVLGIRP